MNKAAITCILVFITILLSITSGCAEAIFDVSNLTIDPQEVESGQSATVSVEIANTGGAEAPYPVMLKINGIQVDEKNVTVGPGTAQQVAFSVTRTESGSCNIDVNGLTATLRVLKPAEFKVESFVVSPTEVTEGGSCTVTVDVTNLGEVEGDYEAILRVNDGVQESKTMTIAAGDSRAVSFSLVMNQAGTYNLSIGSETGTLTVVEAPIVYVPSPVPTVTQLSTYQNKLLYYQISYPRSYSVDDNNAYTVTISGTTGGITVLTDKLIVDVTPKAYFDSISAGKKQQLPTWTATSITEVKEGDVIIGFKYDYSNVVDGKNWLGKGMVFKKGSLGFYVVFTTPETNWKENEEMAVRCLDSFVLPKIVTGSYSNPSLGISLTLPTNWSLIETGSLQTPIKFFSYTGQMVEVFTSIPPLMQSVTGEISIYSLTPGTTAKDYIAKEAGSREVLPFLFANSSTGYEFGYSLLANNVSIAEFRDIALASGSNIYYFHFMGVPGMNAQASSVTQLAKSLVVSAP